MFRHHHINNGIESGRRTNGSPKLDCQTATINQGGPKPEPRWPPRSQSAFERLTTKAPVLPVAKR
jgi:hypothetical protein